MEPSEIARIRRLLSPEAPLNIKAEFAQKIQQEIVRSTLDMQNFVKEQIFTKIKRPPYISGDEIGPGRFWCLDCGDKYSLKSSYDFHLNRSSIKITHSCDICEKTFVFTNKCLMLAHVRGHTNSTLSFNLAGIVAEPLPSELVSLCRINLEYDYSRVSNMTSVDLDIASRKLAKIKKKSEPKVSQKDDLDKGTPLDQLNKICKAVKELGKMANCFDGNNTLIVNGSNKSSPVKKTDDSENTDSIQIVDGWDHQKYCNVCLKKFSSAKSVSGKDAITLHFQRLTFGQSSSCQYCKLQMPNNCAQIAHNNIHTNKPPPYNCPECGLIFSNQDDFRLHLTSVCHHFSHALNIECQVPNCFTIHSTSALPLHFISRHTKQLFKCHKCSINFNSINDLECHAVRSHKVINGKPRKVINVKSNAVYQCLLCDDQIFNLSNIKCHIINVHKDLIRAKSVYFCRGCNFSNSNVDIFVQHISKCVKYIQKSKPHLFLSDMSLSPEKAVNENHSTGKSLQKTCTTCKKSFVYLYVKVDENKLPNKCPLCGSVDEFKTSSKVYIHTSDDSLSCQSNGKELSSIDDASSTNSVENQNCDIFTLLNEEISNNENEDDDVDIDHFQPKTSSSPSVMKINKRKVTRNKRKHSEDWNPDDSLLKTRLSIPKVPKIGQYICAVCSYESFDKKVFHDHIINHKNVSTAYQCMDCGLSFTVRPSFVTHLLTAHGISNIDDYLQKNNCVDLQALAKLGTDMSAHPANENQCSICYEQFENKIEHDKHFRIHGMAFLANTKQMTTQKSAE